MNGSARAFTPNQRLHLIAMHDAGAVSRGASMPVRDLTFGSALVIGKLRDLGLADSKTVHRLGRQWTEYWLTSDGAAATEALKSAMAATKEDRMGEVTQIDFAAGRQVRAEPRARDDAWADHIADAWYSPAGRVAAALMVFGVVATGLVVLVIGVAAILGRL